jgi:hypothetical protein
MEQAAERWPHKEFFVDAFPLEDVEVQSTGKNRADAETIAGRLRESGAG